MIFDLNYSIVYGCKGTSLIERCQILKNVAAERPKMSMVTVMVHTIAKLLFL